VRTPAYDGDDKIREGAHVAEVSDLLDLTRQGWPAGMRVIVRREKPHPGAQLRITDANGWRITAFATVPTSSRQGRRSCHPWPALPPAESATPTGWTPQYAGTSMAQRSRMFPVRGSTAVIRKLYGLWLDPWADANS
jgi:hypothetical protein